MKSLVTIAFISTCFFSFGQSNMFWNNYGNINPAMSGFQYNRHASATYNNSYPALSGGYASLLADVGTNIGNHHGVGVVYSGDYMGAVNSNKALLNYNYQFHFKKAGKLAFGTGIGVGHTSFNYDKLTFGDFTVLPEPETTLELNAGISYNWRNLIVGLAATNLTPSELNPINTYYYSSLRTGYHFHAQYAFQVAEKFQLTPHVLYAYHDGFQQLRPNLTVTYDQKFHLGISSQLRDNLGVNLGWDIQRKFRIAYCYNVTVSKLNNGASGEHEFSIGYLIKSAPMKQHPITPPNF